MTVQKRFFSRKKLDQTVTDSIAKKESDEKLESVSPGGESSGDEVVFETGNSLILKLIQFKFWCT